MNFQTIIEKLAAANEAGSTWVTLAEAVAIANVLAVPDAPLNLSTFELRVAFARTVPEVVEAVLAGKKIVAIKALREASKVPGVILPASSGYTASNGGKPCLGLKDAKDAVYGL